MGDNEPKKKNFFETVGGIITGVTALIVAITGLIAVLNNLGCFKPKAIDISKVDSTESIKQKQDEATNNGQTDSSNEKDESKGSGKQTYTNPNPRTPGKKEEDAPSTIPQKEAQLYWNEDEEIKKEQKSAARYIYNLPKQNPITIGIKGTIIFPVGFELGANPYSITKIILKVYINDQTNELWDIQALNKKGENYYIISKSVTLERPETDKLKVELLLSHKPETNFIGILYSDYNAIIQKGFTIETKN
jgi:hypothetical protein